MACAARIQSGPVTVSLTPEPGSPQAGGVTNFDRSIVSVVVLGNGIAGVTAADFVRRGHPDCEIHVVGSESHTLYNRMGISRLVYGRSAMQGLYLLPEQWYDDHQIVAWLNTQASRIDLASRRVFLATGDTLPYDRLILATGSSSASPPVAGFGQPILPDRRAMDFVVKFVPRAVYVCKPEFYDVPWGGFQLGRVSGDSAGQAWCTPL